jgi:hypothetical protein
LADKYAGSVPLKLACSTKAYMEYHGVRGDVSACSCHY